MDGPTYTALNEGRRRIAYRDSVRRIWTVGVGFTGRMLTTGVAIGAGLVLTDREIDAEWALRYPAYAKQAALDIGARYWGDLGEVRRAALTDIAYQDGGGDAATGVGGLAAFQSMIAAVRGSRWQAAHDECVASLNERQTPARCQRNATMLLTGAWPAVPW